MSENLLIVICGKSGSGKTTVQKFLETDCLVNRIITHTTRNPRASQGEVHGEHYFFVSKKEFENINANNQFLETNNFNDNFYGCSLKALESIKGSGKFHSVVLEYNGVNNVIEKSSEIGIMPMIVFLDVDSEELRKRLNNKERGDDFGRFSQEKNDDWKNQLNRIDCYLEVSNLNTEEIAKIIIDKANEFKANLRNTSLDGGHKRLRNNT